MRFTMQLEPPIVFSIDDAGGWHIRSGFSKFLIAEGSGYSRPIGMQLFRELTRQYGHARGYLTNSTEGQREVMTRVSGCDADRHSERPQLSGASD